LEYTAKVPLKKYSSHEKFVQLPCDKWWEKKGSVLSLHAFTYYCNLIRYEAISASTLQHIFPTWMPINEHHEKDMEKLDKLFHSFNWPYYFSYTVCKYRFGTWKCGIILHKEEGPANIFPRE
jgi:hypothetical protein